MELVGAGKRVTIYIGESDRWNHQPLYMAIVERLREKGFAGATVVRGLAGFGAHSRLHTAHILRLSEDLPVRIEVIERPERVERLLNEVGPMIEEGLVTVEDLEVHKYTPGREP